MVFRWMLVKEGVWDLKQYTLSKYSAHGELTMLNTMEVVIKTLKPRAKQPKKASSIDSAP